ncbi:enoyl-CoA hydratase/isomerase family protein [Chloroflexota bacterium]
MIDRTVVLEKIEAIGIIRLNRPETGNAINEQVAAELTDICHQINIDDAIRVVIVTGAGHRLFSIGSEINKRAGKKVRLISVATPIAALRCPTIAAINGDALGQGLEMALACDIRISANKARFALPQITSALLPWDGGTQRLLRIVGITEAMNMVLTGDIISAREALRIGLVSKVVTADELMPQVKNMAQLMASQSPLALSFAKEAIHKGMDMTLEQGLHLEADHYFLLHTTADRTEGIKAFMEKRPPKFKGK